MPPRVYSTCAPTQPPRLGIMAVLRGDISEGFLTHAGLKCSSWVPVNRGTSSRAACCSIGDMSQPSVVSSNCMTSRTLECDYFVICILLRDTVLFCSHIKLSLSCCIYASMLHIQIMCFFLQNYLLNVMMFVLGRYCIGNAWPLTAA